MFRDCAGRLGHSSDLGLFSWSLLSSLVQLVSCDLAGAGSPRVASGTWLTLASLLTGALCSSSSMWSPFLHQFRFICALVSGFQAPQEGKPPQHGCLSSFYLCHSGCGQDQIWGGKTDFTSGWQGLQSLVVEMQVGSGDLWPFCGLPFCSWPSSASVSLILADHLCFLLRDQLARDASVGVPLLSDF